MKDHGQQARASEHFAGPVDSETPQTDLPVHFFKLSYACWPWSFISPAQTQAAQTVDKLFHTICLLSIKHIFTSHRVRECNMLAIEICIYTFQVQASSASDVYLEIEIKTTSSDIT